MGEPGGHALGRAGNWAECVLCEEVVKFRARERRAQVICNVYVANKWDRVEHFHPDCYQAADEPHGAAPEVETPQRRKAPAASKN